MTRLKHGLAGFVVPPRAELEVSEDLEHLKGVAGNFGPIEKEKFGLLQLAALRAGLEVFGKFEAFQEKKIIELKK